MCRSASRRRSPGCRSCPASSLDGPARALGSRLRGVPRLASAARGRDLARLEQPERTLADVREPMGDDRVEARLIHGELNEAALGRLEIERLRTAAASIGMQRTGTFLEHGVDRACRSEHRARIATGRDHRRRDAQHAEAPQQFDRGRIGRYPMGSEAFEKQSVLSVSQAQTVSPRADPRGPHPGSRCFSMPGRSARRRGEAFRPR